MNEYILESEETLKPFISVVIPTYDAEKTIGRCIAHLISQEYPCNRFEVIVVDEGNDNTGTICKQYRVRYFHKRTLMGPGSARNFGVEVAKGNIVAFIDADCLAPKCWLSKIAERFQEHPGVVGVIGFYCGGRNFAERVINKEYVNDGVEVGQFMGFCEGNSAFKREVFEKGCRFGACRYEEGSVFLRQLNRFGYKILTDYSLRVTHLSTSLTHGLVKLFIRGRDYYYGSRKYFHSFHKAVSFSLFIIFSLILLTNGFSLPIFILPFVLVNVIFTYYILKGQAPLPLIAIPVFPYLLARRWSFWLGFIYEEGTRATGFVYTLLRNVGLKKGQKNE